MNNLAAGYQAAGKLDKALPLLKETLALTKSKLGPDHPDTLLSMNNLAAGYWSTKRLDKSIPLFEEVLTLKKKKLGRDHPNTLSTVANLGVNYKDAGRLAEAIPLLEEAYHAAKTHPTLRWVGGQLLDAYTKAGENAKLADLLQEQLAEARKTLPKDSPQLAGLLAQIGLSLAATEEVDRGRTAPPRVPGHPRESSARRLVHLQHAVNTRRGLAGPEEVRRGRTTLAERLRGDEAAGENDPAAGRHPYPRSPRPPHRACHRHE